MACTIKDTSQEIIFSNCLLEVRSSSPALIPILLHFQKFQTHLRGIPNEASLQELSRIFIVDGVTGFKIVNSFGNKEAAFPSGIQSCLRQILILAYRYDVSVNGNNDKLIVAETLAAMIKETQTVADRLVALLYDKTQIKRVYFPNSTSIGTYFGNFNETGVSETTLENYKLEKLYSVFSQFSQTSFSGKNEFCSVYITVRGVVEFNDLIQHIPTYNQYPKYFIPREKLLEYFYRVNNITNAESRMLAALEIEGEIEKELFFRNRENLIAATTLFTEQNSKSMNFDQFAKKLKEVFEVYNTINENNFFTLEQLKTKTDAILYSLVSEDNLNQLQPFEKTFVIETFERFNLGFILNKYQTTPE